MLITTRSCCIVELKLKYYAVSILFLFQYLILIMLYRKVRRMVWLWRNLNVFRGFLKVDMFSEYIQQTIVFWFQKTVLLGCARYNKTKKATTILRETERLPPFILPSSLWKYHPSPNQWRFSYSCGWYQIWFSPTCLVGCVYTIASSFSYRVRYYLFSFQFDLRCDIHFWNICSLAVIRINLAVCCL